MLKLCWYYVGIMLNLYNHLHLQISTDKLIKDRLMAKNAVEEYVYDVRDKMYGKFEKFISEDEKTAYMSLLTKTEDWLYDEGENCQKQVQFITIN